jgi:hypothetical protein
MRQNAHFHLLKRLRIVELYLPSLVSSHANMAGKIIVIFNRLPIFFYLLIGPEKWSTLPREYN